LDQGCIVGHSTLCASKKQIPEPADCGFSNSSQFRGKSAAANAFEAGN
jgi:hypothetical protein